jgi:hypothetical protein
MLRPTIRGPIGMERSLQSWVWYGFSFRLSPDYRSALVNGPCQWRLVFLSAVSSQVYGILGNLGVTP